MAERTLLGRGVVALWLLAIWAGSNAVAQNLTVGPGAIVLRQYRPGAALYSPNTYTYIQPNPYIYGPLSGTRIEVYSPPRIQPYAIPPAPYREYYTPHIPRYYRSQEKSKQSEAPVASGSPGNENPNKAEAQKPTQPQAPEPAQPAPARVAPEGKVEPPSSGTDQVSSGGGERPQSRPSQAGERPPGTRRRKPIRYR
jgi:hypothetical protein